MLHGVGVVAVAVLAAALITPLVWLAGLLVSLRGTKPGERPEILRAYGSAQPRRLMTPWRRRSNR